MGSTLGTILISYDVASKHTEVKQAMKDKGYFDHWRYNQNPVNYLPNTTLWHDNKTSNQAIADIKSVCTNLRVTLEKAVAVMASEFVGV